MSHGRTFRHGIHPEEHKEATAALAVERMPFVERYILPLSQHAGAPSRPLVEVGQQVRRGQAIAEAVGFISTTLHASVDGQVVAIAPRPHPSGKLVPAIEVVADRSSPQRLAAALELGGALDPFHLSHERFVTELQLAGLVGLGGAAFPTHVKYRVPEGGRIERLLVNGCECEPFLTSDHRLMLERTAAVVRGAGIAAYHLGAKLVVFGVEHNKPDAIAALERAVAEATAARAGAAPGEQPEMRVVGLAVKYPQGAEKMLIRAVWGEEVPSGKLPLDLGIVVNNVATMAAIADWFDLRRPLVERLVTVAGPGVRRPANLLVPLGTPVRAVLEHCGGLDEATREVVMGGPMMGTPLASLDVPVIKGTSGLLAFTDAEARLPAEYSCIKCGRCVEACPQFLNPSRLGRLARAGRFDELVSYHATDCVECGSCSFACPSGIPIVQLIRVAKGALRERAAQVQAAAVPPGGSPPKS
ncbi:MAG: electron transport complex subunit RsxC [Thermoanaerobaculia bacterium]|nr:electron transport complex subunit RsxC [Thermoanaerobaculia bacterium]MBP9824008.1 electron transport complex subunit RsxC [Thermoanaerobaculia bacterium]